VWNLERKRRHPTVAVSAITGRGRQLRGSPKSRVGDGPRRGQTLSLAELSPSRLTRPAEWEGPMDGRHRRDRGRGCCPGCFEHGPAEGLAVGRAGRPRHQVGCIHAQAVEAVAPHRAGCRIGDRPSRPPWTRTVPVASETSPRPVSRAITPSMARSGPGRECRRSARLMELLGEGEKHDD